MYRVLTKITITQQPTKDFKTRTGVVVFPYVHDYEVMTTWDTLTDDGTITLPRNVTVKSPDGKIYNLVNTTENLGGFTSNVPLFLRGDKVKIEHGYAYFDAGGNEISPLSTVFEGYISQVTSKKPFVLKIEDNMWKLKQTRATGSGGRTFFPASSYTVEKMLKEMFSAAGLPFTVNDLTNTTAGGFYTQNETIAEVLARLRKDYNFKSYFKGNELRVGSKVYIDSDLINPKTKQKRTPALFHFQQNIIEDNLEYQRKEDLTISAVARTTDEEDTGKTTKDGHAKTKKVKREVLITFANGSNTPTYFVASKDKPIPPNTGGQRFDFVYPRGTSLEQLKANGTEDLRLKYYTGLRGKFTTFGIPFVQFGDDVDLIDRLLPERNGRYRVKAVKYSGGVGGLRQEIELDFLINRLDANGKVIPNR